MADVKKGSLARTAIAFGALAWGASLLKRGGAKRPAHEAQPDDPAEGGGSHARAAEPGRGRQATGPTEIPARGWKDIFWRVWKEVGEDRLLAQAAAVTFYALLSLVPTLAALVSIYGLVSDPADISNHLQTLRGILPAEALSIVGEQLTRIAGQGKQTLGFAFVVSLALSLWSSNAATKAMFDALNVIYEEEEKRGFIKLNLISLTFTLGGILFVILALAAVVVVPAVLNFVGLGRVAELLLSIGRWPLLLLALILALGLLYRYGPSRNPAQWRWITPGSVFAAVVWLAVSIGFSYYVSNFGSYNETYGSLGAAIAFMTWIWLSSAVVLLGAEINSEMEHQTARDSTSGAPKPMGARGARMADSVGAAQG